MLKFVTNLSLNYSKSVNFIIKFNCQSICHNLRQLSPTVHNCSTMSTTIIKSANDQLNYKYLELKNGLKTVLVSDPSYVCLSSSDIDCDQSGTESDVTSSGSEGHSSDEEKRGPVFRRTRKPKEPTPNVYQKPGSNQKLSAMALCVRSGSFCDPIEVQGLAHLVEHVITMGSEKFPRENDLDEYLTSRGGYQNAYTEYEYTLFEIEVQRNHLYGALQRMANFFIKPLLKADSIERETKPVDTEFCEAMNDDDVRVEQILNNIANNGHPFNGFCWGNAKSLKTIPNQNGTDTQKWVKEFVSNNYKADNIHVVIQSQESMETLENWAKELFSDIEPSKQMPKPNDNFGKPFDNNLEFHKLYSVQPVHETDQLTIVWCLPPIKTTKHYDCPPLDYLGHIIGHEGKGSLISLLRKQHLALELSAGIESSGFANNRYSSMFNIQIKLTDLGKKSIDSVVDYVFQYLKVIRTVGPQEWFFDELKNIRKNRFDWREEQSAINNVKKIGVNLNHIPIENVLRGSKLYNKFDKELIQTYLNLLTPNTACFIYMSSDCLKNDEKSIQTEKWFGTHYKVSEVPEKWLQTSEPEESTPFHFPEKNPFIATDFTIKSKETKVYSKLESKPTKVVDKSRQKLWFKLDEKFRLPKAIIKLHLVSNVITLNNIEHSVLTDLYCEYLILILSEEVYSATLAGLHWNLSQSNTGLVVKFGGFNHKIGILLETVVNRMINLEISDSKFADVKKNLAKTYHNIFVEPANLNKALRLSIISNRDFNPVDKRSVLDTVDQKKLQEFQTKLFSDFFIEALILGNITKEESIEIIDRIDAKLKINEMSGTSEEPKLQTMEVPVGEFCCRVKCLSTTNKNSSVTNYYQLKPANIRLQCLTAILSSFMEEPCFDTLRTKEGLGYYVCASDYDTYGVSGYGVSVNSSGDNYDCSFVDQRIETFLRQMIVFFRNLKEDKYKQQVNSIIVAKKTPDLQLSEEFMRFWNEIVSYNYCFDRLDKEIKCLEKLTFKEFNDWALNEVLNNPKKRKLSIQIVGNGKKSLAECLTIDGKELKNDSDEKEEPDKCFKKLKTTYLKSKTDNKIQFIEDIQKFKKSHDLYPINKVVD